jgi:Flp pilus assembly protein TadG
MPFFLKSQALRSTLAEVGRTLARFRCGEHGSIATTFALGLIPISLAVGAAVDYSFANKAKSAFNAAADAGALAAVSQISMPMTETQAKKVGQDTFNAYASTVKRATVNSVTVTVKDDTTGRSAVVSYKATVPTSIMGVMGLKQLKVSGSSTAASALPDYIDFYLLLDNTPSMGVGATLSDISKMVANTPDQCAFACHDLSASPNDYYGLAKKLGVQMRIDVMRQATQKLMDTATVSATVSSQFRMAIYTFGTSAKNAGLTTVQSLTANLSTAKAAASGIDLMTVPYQNYASDTTTDFGPVMDGVNKAISTPGNGTMTGGPAKVLFFVSDGVADRAVGSPACKQPTTPGKDPQTGTPYTRCQEPLDPAVCKAMKDRGVKIAVLYTTYLPLPTNDWYNSWVAPFQNKIGTNMQSCASPGLYFEVSPTQGISDAMTALFKKTLAHARLTK